MLGLKPQQFGRSIKQFFNLADNGVDYGNWIIAGSGSTKSENGIHAVQDGGNDFALIPMNLKNSTDYTIFLEVLNSTLSTGNVQLISSAFIDNTIVYTAGDGTGVFAILATTVGSITLNQYRTSIQGALAGEEFDFKILTIVEGDATSYNITEEQSYGNFDVIYTP